MAGLVPVVAAQDDEDELQQRGITPFAEEDASQSNTAQSDPMDNRSSYMDPSEEENSAGLGPSGGEEPDTMGLVPSLPSAPSEGSELNSALATPSTSTLAQERLTRASQVAQGPRPTDPNAVLGAHHGWRKAVDVAAGIGLGAMTMNPLAGLGTYKLLNQAPLRKAQAGFDAQAGVYNKDMANLKEIESGERGEGALANQKLHYENQLTAAKTRAEVAEAKVEETNRHNQQVEKLNQQKADDKTRQEEIERHNRTMEEISKGNLDYRREAEADRAEARTTRLNDATGRDYDRRLAAWNAHKDAIMKDQDKGYKDIENEFEKKHGDVMSKKDSDPEKQAAVAELARRKLQHEQTIQGRYKQLGPEPTLPRSQAQAAPTQQAAPAQPAAAAQAQPTPAKQPAAAATVKDSKGNQYKPGDFVMHGGVKKRVTDIRNGKLILAPA